MKKRWIIILILTGCIFISSNEAFSACSAWIFSAWTQPKGHASNSLIFCDYVSDHRYTTVHKDKDDPTSITINDDVERVKAPKLTSERITYYGEYGITDTLTVFTSIPWKRIRRPESISRYGEKIEINGIGDIDFGLRYNLFKSLFGSGVLMSIQGAVKIPEAYKYENPLTELNLGDGQYDGTLALLFGRDMGKGYALINAGYKYRFKNNEYYAFKPSDEIKVSMGGGYPFIKPFSIRGAVAYTHSVGNASVSDEMYQLAREAGQPIDTPFGKEVLIKDTLGLNASSLNVEGSLALNLPVQVVLSYSIDVGGIGIFRTKDTGQGKTFGLAIEFMF